MQKPSAPSLSCPACKQPVLPAEFIAACDTYWAALQLVHFRCPHCKGTTEAQLEPGVIRLGYTYAAASVHFCAMLDVPVPGLTVAAGATELCAELDEHSFTITK